MAETNNVRFSTIKKKNLGASEKAGRPIFDTMEVVHITHPADRETEKVFPAHEVIEQREDPNTGEMEKITYALKYNAQYMRFKEGADQIVDGTPLNRVSWISPAKALEYRALKIYTVEQLAHIDGQKLKALGPGGRDLKTEAMAYLEATKKNADFSSVAAENSALKSRLEALEEQLAHLNAPKAIVEKKPTTSPFDDWDDEAIRLWIVDAGGTPPQGNPDHKAMLEAADALNAEIKAKADKAADIGGGVAPKRGRPAKAA